MIVPIHSYTDGRSYQGYPQLYNQVLVCGSCHTNSILRSMIILGHCCISGRSHHTCPLMYTLSMPTVIFSYIMANLFLVKLCKALSDSHGISDANHASFFIKGRPGRGKTFTVRALASTLRSMDCIVLIVSSSAFCAKAYQCGRTAHHMFGIPVTNNKVGLHSHISPFSIR